MRGLKAKALRRLALSRSVGGKWLDYVQRRNMNSFGQVVGSRWQHSETCGRSIYQRLKRAFA